ncbi:MAG: hypothetical protein ABH950_09730 [Candidatus Altiarchaeota archaeon]
MKLGDLRTRRIRVNPVTSQRLDSDVIPVDLKTLHERFALYNKGDTTIQLIHSTNPLRVNADVLVGDIRNLEFLNEHAELDAVRRLQLEPGTVMAYKPPQGMPPSVKELYLPYTTRSDDLRRKRIDGKIIKAATKEAITQADVEGHESIAFSLLGMRWDQVDKTNPGEYSTKQSISDMLSATNELLTTGKLKSIKEIGFILPTEGDLEMAKVIAKENFGYPRWVTQFHFETVDEVSKEYRIGDKTIELRIQHPDEVKADAIVRDLSSFEGPDPRQTQEQLGVKDGTILSFKLPEDANSKELFLVHTSDESDLARAAVSDDSMIDATTMAIKLAADRRYDTLAFTPLGPYYPERSDIMRQQFGVEDSLTSMLMAMKVSLQEKKHPKKIIILLPNAEQYERARKFSDVYLQK